MEDEVVERWVVVEDSGRARLPGLAFPGVALLVYLLSHRRVE